MSELAVLPQYHCQFEVPSFRTRKIKRQPIYDVDLQCGHFFVSASIQSTICSGDQLCNAVTLPGQAPSLLLVTKLYLTQASSHCIIWKILGITVRPQSCIKCQVSRGTVLNRSGPSGLGSGWQHRTHITLNIYQFIYRGCEILPQKSFRINGQLFYFPQTHNSYHVSKHY